MFSAVKPAAVSKKYQKWSFSGASFAVLALVAESTLIVLVSYVTGCAYHMAAYGAPGPTTDFIYVGLLIALFYQLACGYKIYVGPAVGEASARGTYQVLAAWNFAILSLAFLGFLTKSMSIHSRAWLVLLYFCGLASVVIFEATLSLCRKSAIKSGRLTTRRLLVVGPPKEIERFSANPCWRLCGINVVGTAVLPTDTEGTTAGVAAIERALRAARAENVTDIVVLADWPKTPHYIKIAERLMDVPAAVHLAGLGMFDPYTQLRLARVGAHTTVMLRREPLSVLNATAKRAFDIVVAGIAVLALVAAVVGCCRSAKGRIPTAGVLPPAAARVQSSRVPDLEVPHHDDGGRRKCRRPSGAGRCARYARRPPSAQIQSR